MDKNKLYQELQKAMSRSRNMTYISAIALLPFIIPKAAFSIVDAGFGQGDWLRAAEKLGANELLGLESYAIDENKKYDFPVELVDLEKPFSLKKRYDVAVCMEVAEHLELSAAEPLVKSLSENAERILFSAAIPGQGGCFHVNERPPAFWAMLFAQYGKVCVDKRALFWGANEIEAWYRQNSLFFVDEKDLREDEKPYVVSSPLHLVHPDIFKIYAPKDEHVIFEIDESREIKGVRIPFINLNG